MNQPAKNSGDQQDVAADSIDADAKKYQRFESYLLWFILLVSFCITFLPAFTGENDFILRDVGRYYMNFYRQVQEEWNAGRIPLWTPYDNCGTPLLANACTAVFYPPKLIFFLPCSFELNLKIFIIAHFVLTFFTMRGLALFFGLSFQSAMLTGAIFVFSTPVLFGYCNLPFLCGAAWLPLAVLYGWKLLLQPTFRSAWLLGLCLSFMTLAGDPQTAYHTGLILGVALLLGVGNRGSIVNQKKDAKSAGGSWMSRYVASRIQPAKWLILGAILAGGISALQLLPTLEYNKVSVRAANLTPDSIWGVPTFLMREERLREGLNWYDTFIGNPAKPAKHYLQVYSFSYAPTRMIEWVIPGIFGQSIHANERWTCLWGLEEGNVWFPTVSVGIIPLVLAFIAVVNIGKDHLFFKLMSWLIWISLLSLLASFGRYGLYGCWMNTLAWVGMITPEEIPLTGGEIGGLYWLLVTLLPGYGGFRFPAKWLVFTVFGLSLLAGLGFHLLENQTLKLKWTKRICMAGSGLSILTLVMLWLINRNYEFTNASSVITESSMMLIFSSCVAGFAFWLIPLMCLDKLTDLASEKSLEKNDHEYFGYKYSLASSAIFISITCSNVIELHPRKFWKQPSAVAGVIKEYEGNSQDKNPIPPRFFRPDYFVPAANEQSEWFKEKFKGIILRHQEARILGIERDVLSGFMHQQEHFNSVHQFVTIDHEAYEAMFDVVPLPDGTGFFQPRRAYDLWGTKYFITHKSPNYGDTAKTNLGLTQSWGQAQQQDFMPKGDALKDIVESNSELSNRYPDLMIKLNGAALPIARIVHQYTTIPSIHPLDIAARNQLYFQMILGVNGGMDHQRSAIVEMTDSSIQQAVQTNFKISAEEIKQEHCRIIHYSPQRITLDVELNQPGLVILSGLNYPGWKCNVVTTDFPTNQIISEMPERANVTSNQEILKVNHLMRGILLNKAGRYQLELIYAPATFFAGCWITLVTILLIFFGELSIKWQKNSKVENVRSQVAAIPSV